MVDLAPKAADSTDDRNAAPEEDYQPITAREEMDFVKMLNEFECGISEASLFHEKLTKKLQDLDNTNIESIMTNEQAVTKLIEDLDKCEERMCFLSDRLQAYDEVLNVSIFCLFPVYRYFSKWKRVLRSSKRKQNWKRRRERTWVGC